MKKNQWEKIGLSLNESRCYLALIKLAFASANEISRKSGIHHVSVYDALRGLKEKELISQIMKSNKLLFKAGNPKKFNIQLKKKNQNWKK